MSRSAFAARFSELVGVPAMQYVARWRMHLATSWLRDEHRTRNTRVDGTRTVAAPVLRCRWAQTPCVGSLFAWVFPAQVTQGGVRLGVLCDRRPNACSDIDPGVAPAGHPRRCTSHIRCRADSAARPESSVATDDSAAHVWYAPAGDPPRAPVVRRVEGLRSSGATPLHLVLDHDLPAIGRGVTAREIGQEIGQLIGLTASM